VHTYTVDPWHLQPWRWRARVRGELVQILDHPLVRGLEGKFNYRPDTDLHAGVFSCDNLPVLEALTRDFPELDAVIEGANGERVPLQPDRPNRQSSCG
jgi:hypothetical protein